MLSGRGNSQRLPIVTVSASVVQPRQVSLASLATPTTTFTKDSHMVPPTRTPTPVALAGAPRRLHAALAGGLAACLVAFLAMTAAAPAQAPAADPLIAKVDG